MRGFQALMMLFGALAVLMTGVLPAVAASAPPCHETSAHHGGGETPAPQPDKPLKAMNCCVACVAAPALPTPEASRVAPPRAPAVRSPAVLQTGRTPSPEPHPPRSIAS